MKNRIFGDLVLLKSISLVKTNSKKGCFSCLSVNSLLSKNGICAICLRRKIIKCYASWKGTYFRCENRNANGYEYYGGKGIKSFLTLEEVNFMWDRDGAFSMQKPSIDRLDSNDHYMLANCRFLEFSDNTRKAVIKRMENIRS